MNGHSLDDARTVDFCLLPDMANVSGQELKHARLSMALEMGVTKGIVADKTLNLMSPDKFRAMVCYSVPSQEFVRQRRAQVRSMTDLAHRANPLNSNNVSIDGYGVRVGLDRMLTSLDCMCTSARIQSCSITHILRMLYADPGTPQAPFVANHNDALSWINFALRHSLQRKEELRRMLIVRWRCFQYVKKLNQVISKKVTFARNATSPAAITLKDLFSCEDLLDGVLLHLGRSEASVLVQTCRWDPEQLDVMRARYPQLLFFSDLFGDLTDGDANGFLHKQSMIRVTVGLVELRRQADGDSIPGSCDVLVSEGHTCTMKALSKNKKPKWSLETFDIDRRHNMHWEPFSSSIAFAKPPHVSVAVVDAETLVPYEALMSKPTLIPERHLQKTYDDGEVPRLTFDWYTLSPNERFPGMKAIELKYRLDNFPARSNRRFRLRVQVCERQRQNNNMLQFTAYSGPFFVMSSKQVAEKAASNAKRKRA